jgi:hypothetical protein
MRGILRPAYVRTGFVRTLAPGSWWHVEQARRAETAYRARRSAVGIAEPPPTPRAAQRRRRAVPPGRGDVCLVGVIAPVGTLPPLHTGGPDAVRRLFTRMGRTPSSDAPPFLYVYFLPEPGGRLTADEAGRLLERLRVAHG